jgi:hypothetical protein
MTKLMAEAIQLLIDQEDERERANKRIIARMENARNLGTSGEITWTRDELYER